MNDITIGGPIASIASETSVVIDGGSANDMHLNVTKCELISNEIHCAIVPIRSWKTRTDDETLL